MAKKIAYILLLSLLFLTACARHAGGKHDSTFDVEGELDEVVLDKVGKVKGFYLVVESDTSGDMKTGDRYYCTGASGATSVVYVDEALTTADHSFKVGDKISLHYQYAYLNMNELTLEYYDISPAE